MIEDYLMQALKVAFGAALTWFAGRFRKGFRKQFFFKVFGGSVANEEETSLVYGEFLLHPGMQFPPGVPKPYAYVKPVPTPKVPTNLYSISKPISSCEIRAAKYLTERVSRELDVTPLLRSDLDSIGLTDFSYISFGGPGSNLKSYDAIFHQDNGLVLFDNQRMWEVRTGRTLFTGSTPTHDYGLILKVCPSEHASRGRVWIVCAGFGEWGTSGSARYLAYNWRSIATFYGEKPFAIIVQVEGLKDDSAREVYASLTI